MMEMICAGVGGQGVLTLGMVIAMAGASEGKNVTWIPSYGSEMRGGRANCNLKISEGEIATPYVRKLDMLVALSEACLEEFGKDVKKGGYILSNSSMIKEKPEFEGVNVVEIPANDIAMEINNPRGMSLVMAGAVVAVSNVVTMDSAKKAMHEYFEGKKADGSLNEAAIKAGYDYIKG